MGLIIRLWNISQNKIQLCATYGVRVIPSCSFLHSETGHFGDGRAEWIEEIANECCVAIEQGIPLLGVCIYPVTDRPDWDDLSSYSDCGIYDLDDCNNRLPHIDSINAIKAAQLIIAVSLLQKQDVGVL